MFCPKCGTEVKKLNSKNVEDSSSNLDSKQQVKVAYQCPTCGRFVHEKLNEEDTKSLNQVAHSKVHKARYDINTGLCMFVIGLILAVIGIIFFVLSFDLQNNYQLDTERVEFYVFLVCFIIGCISMISGVVFFVLGHKNRLKYETVIKDLANNTFVQN